MEAAALRTPRPRASDPLNAVGPAEELPLEARVALDQLDVTVRLAVAYLLPKGKGNIFIAHLLLDASIKLVEIPGIGLVNACVLSLPSIEAFARGHGQSKDTAYRYIDILEALRILFRSRHADSTELHIPLTPWTPSVGALAALDALQAQDAARAKLRQLAHSVQTRFLLLYGAPSAWLTLYDDLQGTLAELADQLAHRVSATKRTLLQVRLMNLQHRLCGPEGDCLKEGDPRKREVVGQTPPQAQEGDFSSGARRTNVSRNAEKGDFHTGPGSRNISSSAQQGDFHTGQNGTSEQWPAEKGDFSTLQDNSTRLLLAQEGDLAAGTTHPLGNGTAQKGDFQGSSVGTFAEEGDFYHTPRSEHGVTAAHEGDFHAMASLPSFNVNVRDSSKNSSLKKEHDNASDSPALPLAGVLYTSQEAAQVGRSLAAFFEPSLVKMTVEESRRAIGGFVNKCKRASPRAVRAAVIDTLVHDHFPTVDPADTRGRPGKRAAWFHRACEHYRAPDALVPPFVQTWLDTDLSWKEIETQLGAAAAQYGYAMVEGDQRANLVRSFLCGAWSRQELDEALHQAAERTHRRDGAAPLGKVDAEELARYVMQDGTPYGVTSVEVRLHQGAYVVEVWKGELSLKLATVEDWVNLLTALEQKAQAVEGAQRRRQKT